MFFAVPHRGMLVEDMREMLQQEQHPRETIMKEIDQESSDIVKRVQDFEAVIQNRQIVSFYETALTPSLQMVWTRQQTVELIF